MIVTQKMFGYCGGLRAVSLFVNRSAIFIEAVFKSTFGFSYVLFMYYFLADDQFSHLSRHFIYIICIYIITQVSIYHTSE